jgi:aminoglycoside phosphotransferase (APT) family kinase protein
MLPSAVHPDFAVQDAPSPEFIEELRSRFPTEPEVDKMLTSKMRNRSGPPHHRVALPDMVARLERFLAARLDAPFEVSEARWFAGGVSKIQVGFTLTWKEAASGETRTDRMVVRMDPAEGSNATSRLREFELLRFVRGHVPVPEVFWVDTDADWFPRPALVYAFAEGVTKPPATKTGSVSGIGTQFGAEYRALLAPQYLEHLAMIHTLEVSPGTFSSLEIPEVGSPQAAQWLLNQARRTWDEDRGEDVLLMEVAANWLADNVPSLDRVSVVHGDFRSGNFLFDGESGRITAWLDWERGHLGDRHRDLAWMTNRTFGHAGDEGRFYVCGLVAEDEFYDTYERLSGLPVEQERLDYYRILNDYTMVVSALGSAYRVSRLGKTHQDILLTRLEGVVPVVLRELRDMLKERI